ncbi:spore coat protein GerQ [Paenibacillus mendelii]|uniref:Spore coat protein GerQ n=1 Tax=Paenibacillus mendelii TaxID=206163 RepID=A0ABV6JMS2_9BACL|nr:spore coat protein GerQ [Paenibacillus mendelii]MCQ6558764.1 spore coat protein GerQ [Paenibacillus mendelii]
MSNGYGYKTAVSPANTGGWGGYGYPYAPTAQTLPASPMPAMPTMTAPMMAQANMPITAAAQANMPMTAAAQANMPMTMAQAQANMPMTMGASMMPPSVPSGSFVTQGGGNIVQVPVVEESYVENILRLNRGKMATFYMTYENNREWNAKIFRGIIEAAGRDHIIISDPSTGMRYLLLTLNLDYVTFDGPVAYEYPFQGGSITNTTPLTPPATGR